MMEKKSGKLCAHAAFEPLRKSEPISLTPLVLLRFGELHYKSKIPGADCAPGISFINPIAGLSEN